MQAKVAAPSTSAASSLPYMPGLDLARGLAILMVLLDHGLATNLEPYLAHASAGVRVLEFFLRFGHMGVHLFFILSGFLITTILLHTRTQPDYFRTFYARRALRILPAYLLILGVLVATHFITTRYLVVCLLFLCNMPSLLGVTPQYSPLWSLSVEEQFYLLWPIAVRKLSTRNLAILCASLILFTPVLRFALLYCPAFMQDVRFKTWAVADFFAAGALLAIGARLPHLRPILHQITSPLLLSATSLFLLQQIAPQPASGTLINLNHATFLEPWLLGLSGFVLLALLHPSAASSILFRPLIFLAKISYGLYLCHVFLFHLIDRFWHLNTSSSVGILPQIFLRFLCEAVFSIAIAALSRYTVEEFFLRLKPKHRRTSYLHNAVEKIT